MLIKYKSIALIVVIAAKLTGCSRNYENPELSIGPNYYSVQEKLESISEQIRVGEEKYSPLIVEKIEQITEVMVSGRAPLQKIDRSLPSGVVFIPRGSGPFPVFESPRFPDVLPIDQSIEGVVIGSPAILRDRPTSSAPATARVAVGDRVYVMRQHSDWYAIVLDDKRLGYIFRDLVRLEDGSETLNKRQTMKTITEKTIKESVYYQHGMNSAISQFVDAMNLPEATPIKIPSALPDLRTAVDEMADAVEKERPEFTNKSFECRNDLQQCRASYGYLDCELTMITCLLASIGGG